MAKRKIKRVAIKGFKHKKVPGHPASCRGYLHPLRSKPNDYLFCDGCSWQVAVVVAEKYGYKGEA